MDRDTILFASLLSAPAVVASFGPVLLLQALKKYGWALFYPVAVIVLAALDWFINWDNLAYPSPWLAYFIDLPWLGFPIFSASAVFALYRLDASLWRDK